MPRWLNGFDNLITLTPIPFAAAGGLALLIAIIARAGHPLHYLPSLLAGALPADRVPE